MERLGTIYPITPAVPVYASQSIHILLPGSSASQSRAGQLAVPGMRMRGLAVGVRFEGIQNPFPDAASRIQPAQELPPKIGRSRPHDSRQFRVGWRRHGFARMKYLT